MNDAPTAASPEQVYQAIVDANRFDLQSLAANRNLKLSPAQRKVLQIEMRRLVFLLLLCGAAILSAIFVRSAITYGLAILGVIFGAFLGYSYLQWQRAPGQVAAVEGILSREEKVSYGKRTTITYQYQVGGTMFVVSKAAYQAATQGLSLRAYYLVASGNLINLELLTEKSG